MIPDIQVSRRVTIGEQSGILSATTEKISVDLVNMKGAATLAELQILAKIAADLTRRIGDDVSSNQGKLSKVRRSKAKVSRR